jgi:hypothetical protein
VIHSLSKWIGGHGAGIGGAVVDSGGFDWKSSNVPLMTEPDPAYHGLRWASDLPDALAPIAFALRFRTGPLRNLGACLSPDNAWIFLQGTETLALRMERHNENAQKVAEHLARHPKVAWVRYPGLASDPAHAIAARQFAGRFGGMVVFGIKDGRAFRGASAASASSTRFLSSRTWRTSATRRAWRSIRRAPRTRSYLIASSARRASCPSSSALDRDRARRRHHRRPRSGARGGMIAASAMTRGAPDDSRALPPAEIRVSLSKPRGFHAREYLLRMIQRCFSPRWSRPTCRAAFHFSGRFLGAV